MQMVFTDLRSAPQFLPVLPPKRLEQLKKAEKEEKKKDRNALQEITVENDRKVHISSRWTAQKASRRGVM